MIYPGGFLLLPDVCVPRAALVTVRGGVGDLLLRWTHTHTHTHRIGSVDEPRDTHLKGMFR